MPTAPTNWSWHRRSPRPGMRTVDLSEDGRPLITQARVVPRNNLCQASSRNVPAVQHGQRARDRTLEHAPLNPCVELAVIELLVVVVELVAGVASNAPVLMRRSARRTVSSCFLIGWREVGPAHDEDAFEILACLEQSTDLQ